MSYEIVTADGGSLPTIIDSETRECVLGIDERTVNGRRYRTPVFANGHIARRVLRALNEEPIAGSDVEDSFNAARRQIINAPGAYVALADGTFAEQCGLLAWQGDDPFQCLWAKGHQGGHSWERD